MVVYLLEREQRVHEEAIEPAWLAGIGEGTGARIGVIRVMAIRVEDTVLSVAISSARTSPAMRTSSSPVLRVIHFATHGEDAKPGQHLGHGHGDGAVRLLLWFASLSPSVSRVPL